MRKQDRARAQTCAAVILVCLTVLFAVLIVIMNGQTAQSIDCERGSAFLIRYEAGEKIAYPIIGTLPECKEKLH